MDPPRYTPKIRASHPKMRIACVFRFMSPHPCRAYILGSFALSDAYRGNSDAGMLCQAAAAGMTLDSEPLIRWTIPITRGIVLAPPTTVSAIPAALRWSLFMARETRKPMPIPKATRVAPKSTSSGIENLRSFIL